MLTASSKLLANLVHALDALAIDPEPVLQRCKRTRQDVELQAQSDGRITLDVVNRFWSAAVALSGDPTLGVRVGALARIEMFGVLGDVAKASSTLGDALLKIGRYMQLWSEAASLSLLVEGERAVLWYKSLAPELRHPAASDVVLTLLLVLSRQLTGIHLVPNEVRFRHAAPANRTVYRELFGVMPDFNRPQSGLVFPPDALTLPIATHDSRLREGSAQRAAELVGALPAAPALSERVRALLSKELRGGNPILENVASQLGFHPKTLTRRLKEEGTSHREILDSLRRTLAEEYISSSDFNITEVAFLLGFSDTSAFNKAFQRWSGLAPLAFRKRARGI